MKVYFGKSNLVMERWPDDYWAELTRKLSDRGHTVVDNLEDADAYVGPVGEMYQQAAGKTRVGLLGPTVQGEGVKSPIICSGCKDKLENPVDCFFQDELCMLEITPNDVLEVLCG